jgi:hypothetical protein
MSSVPSRSPRPEPALRFIRSAQFLRLILDRVARVDLTELGKARTVVAMAGTPSSMMRMPVEGATQ